jgi:hypothetical protein
VFSKGEVAPHKWLQGARDIVTGIALGHPIAAITQLSELAQPAYLNGIKNNFIEVARTLTPGVKMELDAKGWGFANFVAEDYISTMGTRKFANMMLKAGGFTSADLLGKSVIINGSLRNLRTLARENVDELYKKYGQFFDEPSFRQFTSDLRNGVVSQDVKTAVFMDTAKIQPITPLQHTGAYLSNPNMRWAYTFKSFMLRWVNRMKQDVFRQIAEKNYASALGNFTYMSLLLGASNATTSEIKHILMTGETDPMSIDYSLAVNLLKTFAITEYALNMADKKGLSAGIGTALAPPVQIFETVFLTPLYRGAKALLTDEGNKPLTDAQRDRMFSANGWTRLFNNWLLGGADRQLAKEEKAQRKRERGYAEGGPVRADDWSDVSWGGEEEQERWSVEEDIDRITSLDENDDFAAWAAAVRDIESSNNPEAVSPTGARGLYQFTKGTGKQYGLIDEEGNDYRSDVGKSEAAFIALAKDNARVLKKNNVPITPTTLYLAHQQGARGAVEIWNNARNRGVAGTDEEALASDVERNMALNKGEGRSSSDFISYWEKQLGEKMEEGRDAEVWARRARLAREGAHLDSYYQEVVEEPVISPEYEPTLEDSLRDIGYHSNPLNEDSGMRKAMTGSVGVVAGLPGDVMGAVSDVYRSIKGYDTQGYGEGPGGHRQLIRAMSANPDDASVIAGGFADPTLIASKIGMATKAAAPFVAGAYSLVKLMGREASGGSLLKGPAKDQAGIIGTITQARQRYGDEKIDEVVQLLQRGAEEAAATGDTGALLRAGAEVQKMGIPVFPAARLGSTVGETSVYIPLTSRDLLDAIQKNPETWKGVTIEDVYKTFGVKEYKPEPDFLKSLSKLLTVDVNVLFNKSMDLGEIGEMLRSGLLSEKEAIREFHGVAQTTKDKEWQNKVAKQIDEFLIRHDEANTNPSKEARNLAQEIVRIGDKYGFTVAPDIERILERSVLSPFPKLEGWTVSMVDQIPGNAYLDAKERVRDIMGDIRVTSKNNGNVDFKALPKEEQDILMQVLENALTPVVKAVYKTNQDGSSIVKTMVADKVNYSMDSNMSLAQEAGFKVGEAGDMLSSAELGSMYSTTSASAASQQGKQFWNGVEDNARRVMDTEKKITSRLSALKKDVDDVEKLLEKFAKEGGNTSLTYHGLVAYAGYEGADDLAKRLSELPKITCISGGACTANQPIGAIGILGEGVTRRNFNSDAFSELKNVTVFDYQNRTSILLGRVKTGSSRASKGMWDEEFGVEPPIVPDYEITNGYSPGEGLSTADLERMPFDRKAEYPHESFTGNIIPRAIFINPERLEKGGDAETFRIMANKFARLLNLPVIDMSKNTLRTGAKWDYPLPSELGQSIQTTPKSGLTRSQTPPSRETMENIFDTFTPSLLGTKP